MLENLFKVLKNKRKVLGMNERNLEYIRKYNKRKAIEIADNKILTKEVLTKAQIPTPKLINVIKSYQELEKFDFNSLPNSLY
jgi:carbamoylphosphate synthase large subunit